MSVPSPAPSGESAPATKSEYFFVRRPVLAAVISIVITLLGVFAMVSMPLNRYPEITPPTVQVTAVYPGATAQDVASAVAAPIEQQLSGLDGLLYYKSSNTSDGAMNLSVYFDISRDPDLAAVDVQNAVNAATPLLPAAVRQNGVTIRKANSDILLVAAIASDDPQYDASYLTNYAKLYIEDELKRIPGVGDAFIFGNLDFSMLLSLDPDKMAQLGITVDDVSAAVQEENATKPAGRLGREPAPSGTELTLSVSTSGRLTDPSEFAKIIVRARPDGSVVRLGDIATVNLGARGYDAVGRLNGKPTAILLMYARPGANSLDVKNALVKRLDELSKTFPTGITYRIPFDTTPFITESIKEVIKTLAEAMILVTLVVFLFLQSWRATLIPLLAVPVSLIGTFLGLQALGYSINTLTLFGMVLAIGIVVDDAIVVIENVERIMAQEHVSPREATNRAMRQVSGALIAIVLVLCAVFVPVAFIGGITGALYQQFAVTIIIAVILSGVVALTLTPALCALLLQHAPEDSANRFFQRFNTAFAGLTNRYVGRTGQVVDRPRTWLGVFAVLVVLTVVLFRHIPGGFLPSEDKGFFALAVQLPDAASLQRTKAVVGRIETMLAKEPGVENVVAATGLDIFTQSSQTNSAVLFVGLKPWAERSESVDQILGRVNGQLFGMKDAIAFGFNFPEIPGLGVTSGLEMNLQQRTGGDINAFAQTVNGFVTDAAALSMLQNPNGGVRTDVPQLFVRVDEDAARARGVGTGQVFSTLQAMLSNLYINDFNLYGRTYRVQAEAQSQFRQRPEDVGRFHVRSTAGEMVPLSAIVQTEMRGAPAILTRFNGFPSAQITGGIAPGRSSGEVLDAVEKLVNDKYAAQGIGYAYSGESYQERASAGQSGLVLALGLVLVFLVLAAQYESWSIPFAVLLGLPFGAMGALLGIWMRNMPNDIYFQIGLIAVLGLAAKNAILIVEFANELRSQGLSIREAAVTAARERFRPILMTSFAFIFGVAPLLIAKGAGAGSRHAIGTGVFAGMLFATIVGIFFIPLFFAAIRGFVERRNTRVPRSVASLLILAVTTLAAGCAVGPSTTVTPAPVSVTARAEQSAPATRAFFDSLRQARQADRPDSSAHTLWATTPLAIDQNRDLAWLTVLQDSQLVELVRTAVTNNRDLRSAQARVREFRALLGVANSPFYPQLSGNATGGRSKVAFGATPPVAFDAVRVTADLAWELDFWGRIRRQSQAASFDLQGRQEDVRATVLTLVSDVVTAYLQLREADEIFAIAEQTLASRQSTLDLARRRFNQGLISELDVRQFEAQVAEPAARVADFARLRTERENALSLLLGAAPGPIVRGRRLSDAIVGVAVPDSLAGELVTRRPDVLRAQRDLQAARARVGVAVASRFPPITLTGQYGSQRPKLKGLFTPQGEIYTVQAGISLPLFTGGKLLNQERAARARAEQTESQYEQTVLTALSEANDALAGVRLGRDQLVAQETQVRALESAYAIAQRRYNSGVSSYLEVLDAQRGLFTAQIAFVQGERQYLGAIVSLFRALGGSWK